MKTTIANMKSTGPGEMVDLDQVAHIARELLVITDHANRQDLWLWEHSERVSRVATMLASLPEVAGTPPNRTALVIAGYFHDAGWAIQVREGKVDRWQVLSRPTNELQRELGATAVVECVLDLAAPETLECAVQAIRNANNRNTAQVEAQLIAEAENLDEIGVLYVLRQFRQYQAEGRPLDQLITTWKTQLEYQYWEARVNDTLRFETTRRLARERLSGVASMMKMVLRTMTADDLRETIDSLTGD